MAPLFQYRLNPLPDLITQWESAGQDVSEQVQNWSMLTFGRYWLNTEAGPVPRVHPNAWGTEAEIMEDQVGRFWGEFSEALPAILEPVPEPFALWLVSGAWPAWLSELQTRWRTREDWTTLEAQHLIAKVVTVDGWRSVRGVDVGYGFHDSRSDTPFVRFWRIQDTVTLEWSTPAPMENERPTWVHTAGRRHFALPAFLHEVQYFRAGLRTEMHERLRELEALGWLTRAQVQSLRHEVP